MGQHPEPPTWPNPGTGPPRCPLSQMQPPSASCHLETLGPSRLGLDTPRPLEMQPHSVLGNRTTRPPCGALALGGSFKVSSSP